MPNLMGKYGEEIRQYAVHSEHPQDFTLAQAVIEGDSDELLLTVLG